jgi:site-specific DNA recombinase
MTAPGEPVPVAVLTRTSTGDLQDPVASARRQLRSCEQWLPPGWFIAAVYSDVESGGLDLEARSQGTAWKVLTDAGLPRDGGVADLLTEAASPAPRFAAVVCEDIERSARDTYNALKLEKELSRNGIPLFATDEPADIQGINATAILVRRVKQGVAEWFRLQLKEKVWKGLIEHSLDGYNIGSPPYGYAAQRITHPNPSKAAQGRTKTRLILDDTRAPVVSQIYTWRVTGKLGVPAITRKLNASPALYPPPGNAPAWTDSTVRVILRNPKYTGHMVFGRRRRTADRTTWVPADQWLWSPEPTHPAITDRGTWETAQVIGAAHGTSRDTDDTPAPATSRVYGYRSRVLCRDCRHRMTGTAKGSTGQFIYYRCQHNPGNPRHAAAPGHPRSVAAPETTLDDIVNQFFATRIFAPDRAARLAEQLPATDTQATQQRDEQADALRTRIKQLDTAQNAQITALETIPADSSPATAEMRKRITARFTELHQQHTAAQQQLDALTAATPTAADPALLDELPHITTAIHDMPPDLKARLLAAFDLTILWNKSAGQATVSAEITDATLQTLTYLLNPDLDGHHDTHPATDTGMGRLTHHPRVRSTTHSPQTGGCLLASGCGRYDAG